MICWVFVIFTYVKAGHVENLSTYRKGWVHATVTCKKRDPHLRSKPCPKGGQVNSPDYSWNHSDSTLAFFLGRLPSVELVFTCKEILKRLEDAMLRHHSHSSSSGLKVNTAGKRNTHAYNLEPLPLRRGVCYTSSATLTAQAAQAQ